jgi:hypothetical protein
MTVRNSDIRGKPGHELVGCSDQRKIAGASEVVLVEGNADFGIGRVLCE